MAARNQHHQKPQGLDMPRQGHAMHPNKTNMLHICLLLHVLQATKHVSLVQALVRTHQANNCMGDYKSKVNSQQHGRLLVGDFYLLVGFSVGISILARKSLTSSSLRLEVTCK